jgi:hypothetical protein
VRSCVSDTVATQAWPLVRARSAPFSVRVPPNSEKLREGTSEIWRTGAGTISYAINNRSTRWLDSAQAVDTSICEETIAGRRARIQYHYGRETFGEGHYLLAFWELEPDRELELIAFSRSPGARDTLFAVARSVEFARRDRE